MPISPDWPLERIEYLLHDAKPIVILTNKKDYKNTEVEILSYKDLVIKDYCEENLREYDMYGGSTKDTYAVMYTSGSSGLPKGIL